MVEVREEISAPFDKRLGTSDFENSAKPNFEPSSEDHVPCPKCSSKNVWQNGKRHTPEGFEIQRWSCRDCSFRFSDPYDLLKAREVVEVFETVDTKSLKSKRGIVNVRQIGVKETKNLAAEQQTTEVPRRNIDQEGAIIDLLWQLKKENYSDDTLRSYGSTLHQLSATGVDLFNPESFKDTMANHNEWTNCRKYNLTKAYRCFLNHHKIEAKLPKYRVTRPLPYVPPEKYLDQLIASCSGQMSVLLQTLKEIGARPGEALKLEWDDIDIASRKITVSHPEKGCNPRTLPISEGLLNLLLSQPRTTKFIFNYKSKNYAGESFRKMRKAAIRKLGNSELRKIDFYTFRYYRATQEYRRYKDFGSVMVLLGHKSLRYVLLYAQLSKVYEHGGEGYICREATNKAEAKTLIEDGFEFVMDKGGASLFRKLK
ncbi:MAG TPA: tyrosine-type recombinase/integrase [Candidatus Nanoarchaeia archaeon]|nr:tyrosine-type recombinase/integrase [Candidatus Nanoarchaeia archaeon]